VALGYLQELGAVFESNAPAEEEQTVVDCVTEGWWVDAEDLGWMFRHGNESEVRKAG